jgi:hypothetical protein
MTLIYYHLWYSTTNYGENSGTIIWCYQLTYQITKGVESTLLLFTKLIKDASTKCVFIYRSFTGGCQKLRLHTVQKRCGNMCIYLEELRKTQNCCENNNLLGLIWTRDLPNTKRGFLLLNCNVYLNPLAPELSVQCTLHKIWDLHGCPLLCMFLAHNFTGCLVFSSSHYI